MTKRTGHLDASEDPDQTQMLDRIRDIDSELASHFDGKTMVMPSINRQIVSNQDNKNKPRYRWYKFKEAFSASLVELLLRRYEITHGRLMDPFAGSGTSLFVAVDLGLDADGIELLPIGQEIITTRQVIDDALSSEDIRRLENWLENRPWVKSKTSVPIPTLRITEGAYPKNTQASIEQYVSVTKSENPNVRKVLIFALLCILESVSYTRKDGQYLRWDSRSGRRLGTRPFDKGRIMGFDEAITSKLREVLDDIGRSASRQTKIFTENSKKGRMRLSSGSCLNILPTLPERHYDVIVTSPPYCNRYDYTRTYALEDALLGLGESEVVNLRQEMLSCTVENRAKDMIKLNPGWKAALRVAENQQLLQSVLKYLETMKDLGRLNNNGIPRMVRGYFYEMACVVFECSRILKPGSYMFMINDNVKYAGASVSVDMIISSMAEGLGFEVENIFVLPNGKGNSSQQMGKHGREELRKCVYVWRKCQ